MERLSNVEATQWNCPVLGRLLDLYRDTIKSKNRIISTLEEKKIVEKITLVRNSRKMSLLLRQLNGQR